MINYIWGIIIIIGAVFGLLFNRMDIISNIISLESKNSIELMLEISGSLCFWCGIMNIARRSGLTEKIARILKPFLKILFKHEGRNEEALGYIILNLTSNMMGISNAATPFGIKAMEEMQKHNAIKDTASNDMALFLVINAACVQFIPSNILAFRTACNSGNPGEVILPIIITTFIGATIGVLCCKTLQHFF